MKNKQVNENTKAGESVAYYCSIHCEGDKTYDQPGDCPVCGMHLVPVKTSGKTSEAAMQHGHHHHDHADNNKPSSGSKGHCC